MADLTVLAGSVPAGTPYPGTFGDFVKSLSSYLTVSYPDQFKDAVVGPTIPAASDQDKVWFKTDSVDGTPRTVNIYVNGNWLEFTQLNFGDMVLVASTSNIRAPWGEGASTYNVAGVQKLTPQTPAPPNGYKYKVYVGNYT